VKSPGIAPGKSSERGIWEKKGKGDRQLNFTNGEEEQRRGLLFAQSNLRETRSGGVKKKKRVDAFLTSYKARKDGRGELTRLHIIEGGGCRCDGS